MTASDERPEAAPTAPDLNRAISDLRFYANRLCVDKPERYEVTITAGDETKLSTSCAIVLAELRAARERIAALADELEMAWVILANVSGGNWTVQSREWQDAAAKWRDRAVPLFSPFAKERAAAAPSPPEKQP